LELPPLKERGFSNKLLECMEKDREIIYEMGYESMWGKNSWLRVHYSPNKENDEVTGANIVVDDITDKKIKEDDLKEMAHRDPLTRAYNRNALESILLERINEANDNNLVSCVAIVDVDDFKIINDSYGHRIGGDEFLIYLHNIKNKEAAEHFIKRIFKKISSGYRFVEDEISESMSLDVSCSIGCSFFPEDGKTVEGLMAKADISLYKVKNCCKANYHIDL
jgi:GGDEF domain-containing protein